jgi:hypothetical protein
MAVTHLTIRQDGTDVVLVINGKATVIPWQHADELAAAIRSQARRAEEEAKKELIAADGSILLRKGIPIGLSDRRDIMNEVAHLAQYDRDLRRYIPGGVRSREQFGTPTIRQSRPRGGAIVG